MPSFGDGRIISLALLCRDAGDITVALDGCTVLVRTGPLGMQEEAYQFPPMDETE